MHLPRRCFSGEQEATRLSSGKSPKHRPAPRPWEKSRYSVFSHSHSQRKNAVPHTELSFAQDGTLTPTIQAVARAENTTAEVIMQRMADGTVTVVHNRTRSNGLPLAIGLGLRTKVNANIGTSMDYPDVEKELRKLKAAEDAGADSIMDLSTGGDLDAIRRELIAATRLPMGSVPIYDAAVQAARSTGSIRGMTPASMLDAIEKHLQGGIDFVTLHCGVTRTVVETLSRTGRVTDIVSRGGRFLATWMSVHGAENPLYENFDRVIELCREYDAVISLGDGLRPGCLADAMDPAQVHELMVLAELAERAREGGVQVMIEGPGHVPLDQVAAQVKLQKELCKGAPFYVLGPLVTDIAPGYDHITAAIGGAVAAAAGADFLCYVTPAEHLCLPNEDHVHQGVIATRIAAHAADIAKGLPRAREQDRRFSELRKQRDWEGQLSQCIDPTLARRLREAGLPHSPDVCSMCGDYCVFKVADSAAAPPKT